MNDPWPELTIEWADHAILKLDQIHDYIALSSSENVADKIVEQIFASVRLLATFPMSGRSGRVPDTRELVIPGTPFIAAYSIDHPRIVILAIYHGAQKWPETFPR